MIGIEDIVRFVFIAIGIAIILGLLWFAIGYGESKFPQLPLVWNGVRVAFVLLVVFLVICIILALIGKPLVRFSSYDLSRMLWCWSNPCLWKV